MTLLSIPMDLLAATRMAIASVIRKLLLYLSLQTIKIIIGFMRALYASAAIKPPLKYYTFRLKVFALRDGLSESYEVLNIGLN